jgi:putative component of toxin-antitoxin plasmid stabilization module
MSSQLTVLERLRAYAAAHPGDVAVVAETVRQNAELDAYAELGELATTWKRRRDAAEREAHLALQELSREWRRRVRERLAREAVNAALDRAVLAGALGARELSTRTVTGMPVPVLDHEPFPLTRWKGAPQRKRFQCRPAWLTLVRAVQRASRRPVSASNLERSS